MKYKNTIFLIDGTLYLYRSYYKYYNLYNNKNILISVIYGMTYIMKKILINYKPNYLSVIFDYPQKNFRNILFDKYKKNRSPCPKNLIFQIPIVKNIIKNMGITSISIPGVESDDIIGTISKQFERNGFNAIILTVDKDMTQLVSKNIKILDIFSFKKKIIGPKEVYYKYNIFPESIVDYFSLIGDLSDNIPGIYGIGPKTAKILINKYKNINNIYLNINNISNLYIRNYKKIIKNLINNKKELMLFNNLIKIKTNIFTGYTINDLKIKNKNLYNLTNILKKYEIKL